MFVDVPPPPDPAPAACFESWCTLPTIVTAPFWIGPVRLKHRPGLYRCLVFPKLHGKAICVRVG